MGLFDLFKKKETATETPKGQILLAMPMFNNGSSFNIQKTAEHLKQFWGVEVSDVSGEGESAAFHINGEMVAMTHVAVQIPWGDIKDTAQYAYNWMTVEKDVANHTGHALVTVFPKTDDPVERHRILSKLLISILLTSDCIGIYQGSQSLLIPREQYLEFVDHIKEGGIPVSLWIYIGLRKTSSGNSAYTYGLTGFNKQEMEIVDSKLELGDLVDFLTNITAYVIGSNITFKSGETLGYTDDQKVKISTSKGVFVEGQSLKLEI